MSYYWPRRSERQLPLVTRLLPRMVAVDAIYDQAVRFYERHGFVVARNTPAGSTDR